MRCSSFSVPISPTWGAPASTAPERLRAPGVTSQPSRVPSGDQRTAPATPWTLAISCVLPSEAASRV